MRISFLNLLFGMVLVFQVLFLSLPVSAQTDTGLRLVTSPLPVNLVTEPGQTISTELKVKNGGNQTEQLQVSVMKFRAYEDSGKPALLEREPGDDFFDWVRFSEPTFSLEPNEWKTITATFEVPATASFGYYYAFVFSRANEEVATQEKETTVVGGTAVLVLLEARVPGAVRQVAVSSFSLDHFFYEFLPTTFTVELKNTGNVHIAPQGNIFINQGKDRDVAILEVNREKGNILPGSTRTFETSWTDGFPVYQNKIEDGKTVLDEEGNPEQELLWDWNNASKLRFGKYTAKMLLIYDDGARDIPIEAEVSFWVIPWRIIGGVVVNFALIVGLTLYVLRLRRRLKSLGSTS